jgi:hypothetical protein
MCYQVVLELQEDGKLITSDDPPTVLGALNNEFIQKVIERIYTVAKHSLYFHKIEVIVINKSVYQCFAPCYQLLKCK